MKDTKNSARARKSRRVAPDLRIVGINFNPAPDAQDRLRRLFTLLVKHMEGNRQNTPKDDSTMEPPLSEDLSKEGTL